MQKFNLMNKINNFNNVKLATKIPLLKMRSSEGMETRALERYSGKFCVIYSQRHGGYKKGDSWVEDMEEADIKKLEDAYAETRDELNNELVYYILKL